MMKTTRTLALLSAFALLASSCEEKDPTSPFKGILLNEIAAHEDVDDLDTWVEIVNTSEETLSLEGLSLYITDSYFKAQDIAKLSGSLAPGERKVLSTSDNGLRTGFASNDAFTLVLGTSNSTPVDKFEHAAADPSLGNFASWQRMPDMTGEWRKLTYSSKGRENAIFDISKTRPTAVWTWGAHMAELLENDAKSLRNLKEKGYDHILLNFAAFGSSSYRKLAKKLIPLCDEIGLTVHVWMQCFYNGDWESPIDDEKKAYKEEVYERIRTQCRDYIETWGVKGVHLDYIRFGGTASKHDINYEVNSVGAVNRCCREIREITDSFDEGLVTSAALMPDVNSQQYYGQIPYQMAQYIHILMPMIYRYGSYNFSDEGFKNRSNYFAEQAAKKNGVSWSGIQTYNAANKGMTAEELRRDIDLMTETKAEGIVLFRYQLGTFPDINDIYKR